MLQPDSPGIILATHFDPHMSAAEILDHLNEGKEILGISDPDQGIRENIPAAIPYYQNCSRRVLEPFVLMRSLTMHVYDFSNPRMMADDRMAENLDVILDSFDLSKRASGDRRHDFMDCLEGFNNPELKASGEFLMRTYADYFKILVHYLGIKSLDEVASFVDRFKTDQQSGVSQMATEQLMKIPFPFLELVLNAKDIESVDTFGRILEEGQLSRHSEFFRKVRFSNLCVLRDTIVFDQLDELNNFFENQRLQENLTRADVQSLITFARAIEVDDHSWLTLFVDLISNSFADRVENGITKLNQVSALEKSDPALKPYLRRSLRHSTFVEQDLVTVAGLAEAGLLKRSDQLILLEQARGALKELLTPELAERLIKTPASQRAQILDEFSELRRTFLEKGIRQEEHLIYNQLNSRTGHRSNSVDALR